MQSAQTSFRITAWSVAISSFLLLTSFDISLRTSVPVSRTLSSDSPVESTVANRDSNYSFSWLRTDTSVALRNKDRVVWQLNYNKHYDKPYFYPLQTAGNGLELAWLRPVDHLWHRGLWFSWKLINKVNYWEEDAKTRLSDGRTKINSVELKLNKDYSALITLHLTYEPEGKPKVMDEARTVFISAPDKNGNYYIDWDLKFKAGGQTVVLDRTPPQKFGGPLYGGYAGLSYRASENMQGHRYVDSDGWESTSEVVGQGKEAKWMDLTGTIGSVTEPYAGVSMFSHPSNMNSPTPWYVYKDKQFAFFNAALLFDMPITIAQSGQMQLLYRVLIHQGPVSSEYLSDAYEKFLKKYPHKGSNERKVTVN